MDDLESSNRVAKVRRALQTHTLDRCHILSSETGNSRETSRDTRQICESRFVERTQRASLAVEQCERLRLRVRLVSRSDAGCAFARIKVPRLERSHERGTAKVHILGNARDSRDARPSEDSDSNGVERSRETGVRPSSEDTLSISVAKSRRDWKNSRDTTARLCVPHKRQRVTAEWTLGSTFSTVTCDST